MASDTDTQPGWEQACSLPEHADASFCGGPSVRECASGAEVPEADQCPEELDDSFTDRCTDQGLAFDYETGSCIEPAADPSEQAVAETTEPAPPPAEQLPVTGIETSLALTGAMLLAVGASILRAVR